MLGGINIFRSKHKDEETLIIEKTKKIKPPKQTKPEKMPKTRNIKLLKFLRATLYTCLLILIINGVYSFFKGDGTHEVKAEIQQLATKTEAAITTQAEVSNFAQSFLEDYLTYDNREKDDYANRLLRYCPQNLVGDITQHSNLQNKADATYVQTLSIKKYADNQYDVTVVADVTYTRKKLLDKYSKTAEAATGSQAQVEVDEQSKATFFYIVPVWFDSPSNLVIEDIPRLAPKINPAGYTRKEYPGTSATEEENAQAMQMLGDFFNSLFSESQNKIDYYLWDDVDKESFSALNLAGTMDYQRIDNLSLYKTGTPNTYLAVVSITVTDSNGTSIKQRFSVSLVKKDKFYAKDINLRTYNMRGEQ